MTLIARTIGPSRLHLGSARALPLRANGAPQSPERTNVYTISQVRDIP